MYKVFVKCNIIIYNRAGTTSGCKNTKEGG